MSLFDLPRINATGLLLANPATGNNDDISNQGTFPEAWGPYAGQPVALIDSALVQALTYGMSDEEFVQWVQQPQTFNAAPPPGTIVQAPMEWNYYGDLSTCASGSVVGVQGASQELVGASLKFFGGLCDINTQGSPPSTQFFIDQLTLTGSDGKVLIKGRPSKGASQWLAFYRNVNAVADQGAGAYVYHVLRKSDPGTVIDLPEFQGSGIVGVIFRYYLFNPAAANGATPPGCPQPNAQATPKLVQFVATFAPLYEQEEITTGPVGRLMISHTTPISTPPAYQNNSVNGQIALAPAVLQQNGKVLSADFSGTFPDNLNGPGPTSNPKFDFGPVSLVAVSVDGNTTQTIGSIDYADLEAGNARGWIWDFDLGDIDVSKSYLQIVSPTYGVVLQETLYAVFSNQQAIYTEQNGSGDQFLNQGTLEPATVSVYYLGKKADPAHPPAIKVWQYSAIPLQAPGNAQLLGTIVPGDPISIDTSQPGNYFLTFTINTPANPAPAGYPPTNYVAFENPPTFLELTNIPSMSIRVLPNNEDFSRYYVDPKSPDPVGNDSLTWNVVYGKVLRTYYLLYPAMSQVFKLNNESEVNKHAQAILDRTELALWMTTKYMPRTRDLSSSRRTLLRAYCLKVLQGS